MTKIVCHHQMCGTHVAVVPPDTKDPIAWAIAEAVMRRGGDPKEWTVELPPAPPRKPAPRKRRR